MDIKDFYSPIIFMIPIFALVWKGATMANQLKNLEALVHEKIGTFCKDNAEMQEQIERIDKDNENELKKLADTLVEIQKSVVRIETKLNINDKK